MRLRASPFFSRSWASALSRRTPPPNLAVCRQQFRKLHQEEPQMQHTSTAAAYDARILKLRLPEQDSLKKAAERCSADPVSLTNIGRAVGQQVRIKRGDDPRFVAVYTVNQRNPDDPSRADIVRAGLYQSAEWL